MSKISGFIYPDHGLKIFAEDFRGEQSAISDEIINRWKEVFGTGVVRGGAVTVSGTALKVDVAELLAFNSDGQLVYFPTQTAQLTLAEGTNYVVARHKFTEIEENQPLSNGQVSTRRENSFELIARTSAPITGDIPLRIVTMASGARTLSTDLRTYAALQAQINRIDELGSAPAGSFADLTVRLTAIEQFMVVGEIKPLDYFQAVSAVNPWFPLTNPDAVLEAVNYPDYVPHLRAKKARYKPGTPDQKDAFDVVSWSRNSNVATLILDNLTPELKMIAALAEANLFFGSYSGWFCINIPVAIGTIAAGDYPVIGLDPLTRAVDIPNVGSNAGSSSVTRTIEIYPHRIQGEAAKARHYQIKGQALVAINDADGEVIEGLPRRDRLEGHWHDNGGSTLSRVGTTGGLSGISDTGSSGSSYPNAIWAKDAISDGVNGTPRTGKTTDPRALGVCFAAYVKRFVP